ncbi:tetratricopeptide repeat protein [Devosia sp. 1566]|uniref:tetratricopeptide repeat protein n=1 Tax=Devosia sp. 1566 TaxID=2499144 RepID=UPI000FD7B3A9|nr:tetratricopeptide repeat protein [Devosia sp. 1566]
MLALPCLPPLLRCAVLAGMTTLLLAGCASNRSLTGVETPAVQSQQGLGELTERYKRQPKDKNLIIQYAAALRDAGQSGQAVAVLEAGMTHHPTDTEITIAYAKALTADGRFTQSLAVIDKAIRPDAPDWNALLVKGATLDQLGRNEEARRLYTQALALAPGEAPIEANLGLSYAMTNELPRAEQHLRRAVTMRGANTRVRQNLALVVGLQGRFDEARALYAAELPPEQVESNMTYVRSLLTQQNRWEQVDQG